MLTKLFTFWGIVHDTYVVDVVIHVIYVQWNLRPKQPPRLDLTYLRWSPTPELRWPPDRAVAQRQDFMTYVLLSSKTTHNGKTMWSQVTGGLKIEVDLYYETLYIWCISKWSYVSKWSLGRVVSQHRFCYTSVSMMRETWVVCKWWWLGQVLFCLLWYLGL